MCRKERKQATLPCLSHVFRRDVFFFFCYFSSFSQWNWLFIYLNIPVSSSHSAPGSSLKEEREYRNELMQSRMQSGSETMQRMRALSIQNFVSFNDEKASSSSPATKHPPLTWMLMRRELNTTSQNLPPLPSSNQIFFVPPMAFFPRE